MASIKHALVADLSPRSQTRRDRHTKFARERAARVREQHRSMVLGDAQVEAAPIRFTSVRYGRKR